jgi:hypothetical protein
LKSLLGKFFRPEIDCQKFITSLNQESERWDGTRSGKSIGVENYLWIFGSSLSIFDRKVE